MRCAVIFVKFMSGIALLWWLGLFSDIRTSGLIAILKSPFYLIGAFLCMLLTIQIYWFRWYMLMRAVGIPISKFTSYKISYFSVFAGLFLPGNSGADLSRLTYALTGIEGCRARLAGSVVIDRLAGFLGLILLCNVTSVAAFCAGIRTGSVIILSALSFSALAAWFGGILLLPFLLRVTGRLCGKAGSERVHHVCSRLEEAFLMYRVVPGALALAAGISVGAILIIVGIFYLLFHGMGSANVSMIALGFSVPSSVFVNMLPVTPGGLGIGESSFSILYRLFDESFNTATCASVFLLCRVLNVISSLPGFILWVFFRRNQPLAEPNGLLKELVSPEG